MLNTYSSSSPNPCGFCSNNTKEIPTEKKGDCLQIDLDGNDTTLFIRETSVEDFETVQEDTIKPNEEDIVEVVSNLELVGTFHEEPPQTPAKSEKTVEDVNPDDKAARNKQFDQLYLKKWSGKTYFEEELRKIRIQEYQKDLEEAIRKRNLWKAFTKDLARERRQDLIRTSGPEWWQEPSRKQICLVQSLGDVITADYEEGVTGRTRQWLLDLGVTTRVTPKQVRACMKNSLLDPIDFLLETHSVILKSQLHIKKKRGDLERPFSVNERLLLTAVCVLHLPTLLTILHYILPPPKPYSTAKHIQELLFGDLDDERVRYSTPYMEPIPFRNESHYINWAVDKVFRALLPSMISTEILNEYKEGSLSFAIPAMKKSILSHHRPSSFYDGKKRETSRFSETSNAGDSITWLISQCIANRQVTQSLFPNYEIDSDGAPRFFSRKLTKISFSNPLTQPYGEENNDDAHDEVSVSPSANSNTSAPKTLTGNLHKNVAYITESFNETKSQLEKEPRRYSGEINKSGQLDFVEELLPSGSQDSQDLSSKHSLERSITETRKKSSTSDNKDEVLEKDEEEHDPEEQVEPERSELEKLWYEILALPKNKQLERALAVLREMGDPLAQLPKVHTIPTVLRWLELRRGKNRILTKTAKEELLRRSRGMWKLTPIGIASECPKVHCSKRVERLLTWDKKKWLGTEVRKAIGQYYTKVKQEKVDNTRTFFPTMLNHYDQGSKLIRNFRDVFFTYLPAREADTFVYRPWQPQESKKT